LQNRNAFAEDRRFGYSTEAVKRLFQASPWKNQRAAAFSRKRSQRAAPIGLFSSIIRKAIQAAHDQQTRIPAPGRGQPSAVP
jgi:hypothetical protein